MFFLCFILSLFLSSSFFSSSFFSQDSGPEFDVVRVYQTSSSMRMELDDVMTAWRCLFGTSVTRVLIISESHSMLQKVQNGWLWCELLPCMATWNICKMVWCQNMHGSTLIIGLILASRATDTRNLRIGRGDIMSLSMTGCRADIM